MMILLSVKTSSDRRTMTMRKTSLWHVLHFVAVILTSSLADDLNGPQK